MVILFKILIGFIVMCILIGISATPMFLVKYYKKDCGIGLKWCLFVICMLIYIVLSIICQYYGILAERKGIPIIPVIVLFVLAGINFIHTQKITDKKNIEHIVDEENISIERKTPCNYVLNRRVYLTITVVVALIIMLWICIFINKHIDFVNKMDNYWEQPNVLTRAEVLSNEIDLHEVRRQVPEKSYNDQVKSDGYFYNMRLVKDDKGYAILFDVWQDNIKVTNARIVEDMQCIASTFLKIDERDKIKIIIRIAPKDYLDTEEIYNDYIPSNIFNDCLSEGYWEKVQEMRNEEEFNNFRNAGRFNL